MQLPSLVGHVQELLGTILKFDEPLLHQGKPADSFIDTFFRSRKYLGSHDRRFIAETTYGILRHRRLCEYALAQVLPEKRSKLSEKENGFLLIMAYLLIIERRSDLPIKARQRDIRSQWIRDLLPEVVQNLPGLLENHTFEKLDDLGIRYSFPDWMVDSFIATYGEEETERLLVALNEQAPLTLRVNTLKTDVDKCMRSLKAEGVETTRTSISPLGLIVPKRINVSSLQSFKDGYFEVQDEGSQLLPLLIDPKPTAKVLDVCAGGGGKTLEMAALMKNRGEIVATDLNGYRLEQLRKRARRAGASNIRIQEIKLIDELKDELSHFFDVVLIDAPCSGLGTIRRNPGMKWTVTESTVQELAAKQTQILNAASSLVKPGGRIAYATCTLLRDENEAVIKRFLSHHTEFGLVPPEEYTRSIIHEPIRGESYIKLLPHKEGTDGFFLAVMRRILG